MWSEPSVESFYPQLYGTFKQCNVAESINFLHTATGTKPIVFVLIIDICDELAPRDLTRPEPAGIGPDMTLFDELFLS